MTKSEAQAAHRVARDAADTAREAYNAALVIADDARAAADEAVQRTRDAEIDLYFALRQITN